MWPPLLVVPFEIGNAAPVGPRHGNAPDVHPMELSVFTWNGSTPGACGDPSALSGTNRATAMPMSSYVDWFVVSYVALLRRMSPGLTWTPQYGSPITLIEKSQDVGGP